MKKKAVRKSKARRARLEMWVRPEKIALLNHFAREGMLNEEIAKSIGISPSTLYEWKRKNPEIAEALQAGAQEADAVVEGALYKRATGYTYVETEVETSTKLDKKGNPYNTTTTREVTKHVIADVQAQVFWLKNRRPDLWRDKVVQELGGDVEQHITVSDEDRALLRRAEERYAPDDS